MRNRVIEVRNIRASELKPHDANWREHPDRQRQALDMVLDDIGFAGALLTRVDADGELHLIDGHLRAERAGDAEVPVVVTDLTADEADELLVVYDPIGEMAEASRDRLAELLKGVRASTNGRIDAITAKLHHDALDRATGRAKHLAAVAGRTDTEPPPPPEGQYRVVVVDPPWPIEARRSGGKQRNTSRTDGTLPYPTLALEEIARLQLPAADSCHLFLWVVQSMMPSAFGLLDRWGIQYGCTMCWRKVPRGTPMQSRPVYNAEFVILGIKGSPKFTTTKGFLAAFEAPRRANSEKPDEFYETIRRVTHGPRIDMFARKPRPGFDTWGNEAPVAAADGTAIAEER